MNYKLPKLFVFLLEFLRVRFLRLGYQRRKFGLTLIIACCGMCLSHCKRSPCLLSAAPPLLSLPQRIGSLTESLRGGAIKNSATHKLRSAALIATQNCLLAVFLREPFALGSIDVARSACVDAQRRAASLPHAAGSAEPHFASNCRGSMRPLEFHEGVAAAPQIVGNIGGYSGKFGVRWETSRRSDDEHPLRLRRARSDP